jgi:hypothetical protein
MIHLWMGNTEVDSCSLHDPSREYDAAYDDAQQWANDYGEPVELWDYEGHETIDDGELLDTVRPQSVQLALVPGAEVFIGEVDDDAD